jgi:transposase
VIFVDESGVSTRLTRRQGRAVRGQRVHDATPQARWQTVTLLGALGLEGLTAAMTVAGACDGEVFRVFLDQVLGPRLRPGQVVAMDNLSVHKVPGVRPRIEARGAQLWYLPRYSPDLSPIEPCWSKVKTALRAAKARTHEALDDAVTAALAAVTPDDARGWFRHCGYPVC